MKSEVRGLAPMFPPMFPIVMKNKMNNKNIKWNQLVIVDSAALPGTNICKIIQLLQNVIDIKFIFLSDVEGAGTSLLFSKERQALLDINVFLKRVVHVIQFDWANFFLFNEYPKNIENKGMSLEEIISKTETTIRAVDDTYIYIYIPSLEVVKLVTENYQIESAKSGNLHELDYPT